MKHDTINTHRSGTRKHAAALLTALTFSLAACSGIELTSVVDTQFLMTTRSLPFTTVLVVCDTRDLGLKGAMEEGLAVHLQRDIGLTAYRDIDLYSPLKTLSEREKVWALKDAEIQAVLYIDAGGSGRPLRDWLHTEAADVDTLTQAWQSSSVLLFLPDLGQVVWAAGLPGETQKVTSDLNTRSFYTAISSDLLRRRIIAVETSSQPLIRGFNR
jgi:hypothetical protein